MPDRIRSFVSSSVWNFSVGSSRVSRLMASPSLFVSVVLSGMMAIEITGFGNVIDSRATGASSSQRVCPVYVCFRPTMATIVPGVASGCSSFVPPIMRYMREIRSVRPTVVFSTVSPCFRVPE